MIHTDFPFLEEIEVRFDYPGLHGGGVEIENVLGLPEEPPIRVKATPFGLVLVVIGLLVLGAVLSGCVTSAEYKAFVTASRGFYDSVGPTFSAAVLADPDLAEQSKKNRLSELTAYEKALKAAEERVR